MPRLETRDGFALPFTIFLVAILTLMLTAAFGKVQSDRRVADASGATVSALAIAKGGLHQYLGSQGTTRPPSGDSVRINVTGGYADVVARVMRKPADTLANWLYIVRSTGHMIDPTQGADPQAVRTIAQFAQWQMGRIDVRAALVSVNKLDDKKAGDPDSAINGIDLASCAPAAQDTFGLLIPTGSNVPNVNIAGSPQGLYAPGWNQGPLADSTHIDWNALINGGFAADYTSNGTIRLDNAFPSQLVTGNATLNGSGTGLLIV
ncbi:MAG: hypothetical protein HY560_09350, partial [Gemmatimonadetes bacterium]|nr:hypothetical protein [Gemmatimonadota bacterium]